MLTPGEILKKRRKALGKTVFEVSQDTRILEKYLKQLEANDFQAFDSPVFAKGFIKIYSQYLGLDDEKVQALFRREGKELLKKEKLTPKRSLNFKYTDISKLVLYLSTILIAVVFVVFAIIKIKQYQEVPSLQIITPISGYISKTDKVQIEGISSERANIFINEKEVVNSKGVFKTEYVLEQGENVITIKAINSNNKGKVTENIIKLYFEPIDQIEEVKEEIKPVTLQLRVKSDPTWIKLVVDDKQKIAQTLLAGYNEKFPITKSFEVISGRIENTQVYLDGKLWPLKINTQTGIASLSCKLENNEIICPN